MRREERVTVQRPVKKQQPDGMSHRWGGGGLGRSRELQHRLAPTLPRVRLSRPPSQPIPPVRPPRLVRHAVPSLTPILRSSYSLTTTNPSSSYSNTTYTTATSHLPTEFCPDLRNNFHMHTPRICRMINGTSWKPLSPYTLLFRSCVRNAFFSNGPMPFSLACLMNQSGGRIVKRQLNGLLTA